MDFVAHNADRKMFMMKSNPSYSLNFVDFHKQTL